MSTPAPRNAAPTTAGDPAAGTAPHAAADPVAAPAPVRPRFEDLPPAAQRALREAEARRAETAAALAANPRPREINGPRGEEPARYGDWERKGIACDF